MTLKQKILLAVGIIGVAIGGFALTKYLTRNVRHYEYYKVTIKEDDAPAMSWEDVE
jgi:hypothetical protein